MDGFLRVGDIHFGQEIDGTGKGRPPADLLMGPDLFGDLPADRIDRRHGGHRILEDHSDLATPETAHLALAQPDELAPAQFDRAFDHGIGVVDQAHDGHERDRLAGPRFTDDAQYLALRHIEGDAVNGAHAAMLGAKRYSEILDLQHQADLTRGSSRI